METRMLLSAKLCRKYHFEALARGVGGVLVDKIKEGMMKSLRTKIRALLVKPALKETMKDLTQGMRRRRFWGLEWSGK